MLNYLYNSTSYVVPLAGTWIEILANVFDAEVEFGRSPRGNVD